MLGTDELFEYIEKYHIELDPRFNDILGRLVKQKNISFIVFFFLIFVTSVQTFQKKMGTFCS